MQSEIDASSDPAYPSWKMEEAKARLSELVKRAKTNQPQKITVHGKEAVVVVSASLFEQIAPFLEQPNIHKLLSESPLAAVDFEHPSYGADVRDVDL